METEGLIGAWTLAVQHSVALRSMEVGAEMQMGFPEQLTEQLVVC